MIRTSINPMAIEIARVCRWGGDQKTNQSLCL